MNAERWARFFYFMEPTNYSSTPYEKLQRENDELRMALATARNEVNELIQHEAIIMAHMSNAIAAVSFMQDKVWAEKLNMLCGDHLLTTGISKLKTYCEKLEQHLHEQNSPSSPAPKPL